MESVTSGYDTSLYYSPSSKDLSNGLGDDRMSVNALSEDMIKSFTPQMSSGKWLSNASANGDLIPAVVTENSNYKTGDIVTIMHKEKVGEMSPDDEDFDYADPYKYEYVKNKVEIVGVIADGSIRRQNRRRNNKRKRRLAYLCGTSFRRAGRNHSRSYGRR